MYKISKHKDFDGECEASSVVGFPPDFPKGKILWSDRRKHKQTRRMLAIDFIQMMWQAEIDDGVLTLAKLRAWDMPLLNAVESYCNLNGLNQKDYLPQSSQDRHKQEWEDLRRNMSKEEMERIYRIVATEKRKGNLRLS